MTSTRAVRAIGLPLGGIALASLAFTACGGSSESGSSTPSAPTSSAPAPAPSSSEPPAPNPSPEGDCTQEALNSAASNATSGAFGGVEQFACYGGYAVVKGKMNDQFLPLLFKAEDGTWTPVEILNVCQAGELPVEIADEVCDGNDDVD